jgi:hypothetical protein
MAQNFYDQASRYTAKLDPPGFLAWLFNTVALVFHHWLDTRRLPFPGEADRICDTVARLEDPDVPDQLWAVPIEFALTPESDLFGRLLSYLSGLWLEERPSDERGARYHVGAAVVNLTGRGRTGRDMVLGTTGLRTCLAVVERNLCDEDAAATLAGIAVGEIAACLLPFVPLMQGGGTPGIITEWLRLASLETDDRRKGDYGGLALVFAEAAGVQPAWRQALTGWNMIQSQQVLEWMAEGKVAGKREGKVEGKREALVRLLELKFQKVPPEVLAALQATDDLDQLGRWFDLAVTAPTLPDFRQGSGL